MRRLLVSLGLVAVLAMGSGMTSFTGAQDTEAPTELDATCASPEASPVVAGTPDAATAEVNAAVVPDDVVEIGPDAGSPEATPGTPEATPGSISCASPEATPNA
jgi:hypothetical protein